MYQVSYLNKDDERVLEQIDFPNYFDALRYAREVIAKVRKPQVHGLMAVAEYIHGPAAGALVRLHASKGSSAVN